MPEKVRWGVLGAAKIAVEKVIPAMQQGGWSEVMAIASRDIGRAEAAAAQLQIPRAYGSYEELLEDPAVEAVYNPLPNHLHVPLSIEALKRGKHVLCEKPLALSVKEAKQLLKVRDETGLQVEEAFMVGTHPQWLEAKRIVQQKEIGELIAIQCGFSYMNLDPENIRNVAEYGGGGIMDIGCYPIFTSRFVLGRNPKRVQALVDIDPDFQVDRLASVILDFGGIHCSFVCGTQMVPYQRVHFLGTEGRLEIEVPFNAPPDRPCRLLFDRGDPLGREQEIVEIPTCDQYTIQGDVFSRSIREHTPAPLSLESSIDNMAVIEAVFRSGESGRWEEPVV